MWKAAVFFFIQGSRLFELKRKSSLSSFGEECLKLITASELKRFIAKDAKKHSDHSNEEANSKVKSATNGRVSNETKQKPLVVPAWLNSWIEYELKPVSKLPNNSVSNSASRDSGSKKRNARDFDSSGPVSNESSGKLSSTSSSVPEISELKDRDILTMLPKALVPYEDIPSFMRYTVINVSPEIAYFDCCRDVCSICNSGGENNTTNLIFCVDCGHGFHSFCLFPLEKESDKDLSSAKYSRPDWKCVDCSTCEECLSSSLEQDNAGDNFIYCDLCDRMYHLSCLAPALKAIPSNKWYCKVGKGTLFLFCVQILTPLNCICSIV